MGNYKIEYKSHNNFDNYLFVDSKEEAEKIKESFEKLKHISNVKIIWQEFQ